MSRLAFLRGSELDVAGDTTSFTFRRDFTHYTIRLGKRVEVWDFMKSIDMVDAYNGIMRTSKRYPWLERWSDDKDGLSNMPTQRSGGG